MATSLLTEYGSLKKSEYEEGKNGTNYYFSDTNDKRIVIKKKDKNSISQDEFDDISKIEHVGNIIKSDILVDTSIWFQNDSGEFYLNGLLNNIDMLDKEIVHGRKPEGWNEVVYATNEYDYSFNDRWEDAMSQEYFYEGDKEGIKIKVVGIVYLTGNDYTSKIYGQEELLDKYMGIVNRKYSEVIININGKNYKSYNYIGDNFTISPSSHVGKGCAYVPEDINYTCKDYNCKNRDMSIKVDSLYYKDGLNLKICQVYNKKNVNNLLGIDKDSQRYGIIYVNEEEYNNLFNKDSYQASVYVDDIDNIDMVSDKLEEMGYKTLQIRHTFDKGSSDMTKMFKIVKLVVVILMVATLFFISYFVIKLILKSRNVYFSTLRILGGNYRQIKKITDIELLMDATLGYAFYIGICVLVRYNVINIKMISNVMDYLKISDYILMYLILIVISYLISTRFSSKLFKKSAMKSYREEV